MNRKRVRYRPPASQFLRCTDEGFKKPHKNPTGVKIYAVGVMLSAGGMVGNPDGKGGGIRGKIEGWSKASRRRMRAFLLTMAPPEGWMYLSASLTIPGPPVEPERAKRLFNAWARLVQKMGWCAVWRLELQERGQLHWHILMAYPPGARWCRAVEFWKDLIRDEGPEVFDPPFVQKSADGSWSHEWAEVKSSRMALYGAEQHACVAERDDGRGAWHRYISDHASKTKQAQIAVGMGRHWGIIGRALYRRVLPDLVADLTDQQYAKLRRAYERLATPHIKAPCVFGSRLGFRIHRGRWGSAVCFCRPETVRRLVDWVVVSSCANGRG